MEMIRVRDYNMSKTPSAATDADGMSGLPDWGLLMRKMIVRLRRGMSDWKANPLSERMRTIGGYAFIDPPPLHYRLIDECFYGDDFLRMTDDSCYTRFVSAGEMNDLIDVMSLSFSPICPMYETDSLIGPRADVLITGTDAGSFYDIAGLKSRSAEMGLPVMDVRQFGHMLDLSSFRHVTPRQGLYLYMCGSDRYLREQENLGIR